MHHPYQDPACVLAQLTLVRRDGGISHVKIAGALGMTPSRVGERAAYVVNGACAGNSRTSTLSVGSRVLEEVSCIRRARLDDAVVRGWSNGVGVRLRGL